MKSHVLSASPAAAAPVQFRWFLQEELANRCARNPRYSLRAFAKYLTLDHSTLSQLLRGRRRFTGRTIDRIGKRLRLSSEMITQFIEGERSTPPSSRSTELRQLSRDAAYSLAEWHHHAILELTRLASFKPDVRWISRVLDIPVDDVNVAITRLTRLRLLDLRSRTSWVDTAGDTEGKLDELPLRVIAALTERAAALTGTKAAGAAAHYSTTTLAVSTVTSRRIADQVERFRREVAELLEQDRGDREQVYCLQLAFFPVADLTTSET